MNDKRSFDAWGNIRSGASTGDPKGRYCASLGHKQDDESGLVYMRARYYEPTSGRFISEDPGMLHSNWFTYCCENPLNRLDGSGRDDFNIDGLLGTIFSGLCLTVGLSLGTYLGRSAFQILYKSELARGDTGCTPDGMSAAINAYDSLSVAYGEGLLGSILTGVIIGVSAGFGGTPLGALACFGLGVACGFFVAINTEMINACIYSLFSGED